MNIFCKIFGHKEIVFGRCHRCGLGTDVAIYNINEDPTYPKPASPNSYPAMPKVKPPRVDVSNDQILVELKEIKKTLKAIQDKKLLMNVDIEVNSEICPTCGHSLDDHDNVLDICPPFAP